MDAKLREAILTRHGGFPDDVSDAELERLWATVPEARRAEYQGHRAGAQAQGEPEKIATTKEG